MSNPNVLLAARAAYEAADAVCAKRVPWETLSSHWRDYWVIVAKAVLSVKLHSD